LSARRPPHSGLGEFVAAGPGAQRVALRAALALVGRRRGRALLAMLGLGHHVIAGLAAMGVYDEPEVARALGWDADAVVARGRDLRHSEGRP
jgi:hypothetical protein